MQLILVERGEAVHLHDGEAPVVERFADSYTASKARALNRVTLRLCCAALHHQTRFRRSCETASPHSSSATARPRFFAYWHFARMVAFV